MVDLEPDSAEVLRFRSAVFEKLGEKEKSEADLKKAKEIEDKHK